MDYQISPWLEYTPIKADSPVSFIVVVLEQYCLDNYSVILVGQTDGAHAVSLAETKPSMATWRFDYVGAPSKGMIFKACIPAELLPIIFSEDYSKETQI